MFRIPSCLLAIAFLGGAAVARADDPAPIVVKEGLTVTATGRAGVFDRHMIVVILKGRDDDASRGIVASVLKPLGFEPRPTIPSDPRILASAPDGKCDGRQIGKVSRESLVSALEATGIVKNVFLMSNSSPSALEEAQKKATVAATQAAYVKAREIAKAGGGRLGKLLGVDVSIEISEEARFLLLKRDGIEAQDQGGETAKVVARYALR